MTTLLASSPVFISPKGSYFYDRPNSLLLAIKPVLFIDSNICGRFGGEFGRNRPEKKTMVKSGMIHYSYYHLRKADVSHLIFSRVIDPWGVLIPGTIPN
jgi:hypothetical protein